MGTVGSIFPRINVGISTESVQSYQLTGNKRKHRRNYECVRSLSLHVPC